MNAKQGSPRRFALTLVAMLVAAAAGSYVIADMPIWTVTSSGPSVSGNVVSLVATNSGSCAFSGYVGVQAVVNDMPIWTFVPVAVGAGQSTGVSAGFPGPVQSVLKVTVSTSSGSF